MSATNDTAARMPLLVTTPHEIREYVREILGEGGDSIGAYTEEFSWRKTDLGANPGTAVAASRQVLGGDVRAVCGWSVAETTGTAGAIVRLHDGSQTTGEVFTRINLVANESVRDIWPGKGIRCFTGRVFLEVVSGSVEGVLYWR